MNVETDVTHFIEYRPDTWKEILALVKDDTLAKKIMEILLRETEFAREDVLDFLTRRL